MKTVAEELTLIIKEVKKSLADKIKNLSLKNTNNNKNQTLLDNLSKRIDALEEYINEIKRLNSSNPSLLINFRKRATDIKNEIELIK